MLRLDCSSFLWLVDQFLFIKLQNNCHEDILQAAVNDTPVSDPELSLVALEEIENLRNSNIGSQLEDKVAVKYLDEPRLFEVVPDKGCELIGLFLHICLSFYLLPDILLFLLIELLFGQSYLITLVVNLRVLVEHRLSQSKIFSRKVNVQSVSTSILLSQLYLVGNCSKDSVCDDSYPVAEGISFVHHMGGKEHGSLFTALGQDGP